MRTQKTYVAVLNISLPKTDTFFYLMPYQITVTMYVTSCNRMPLQCGS